MTEFTFSVSDAFEARISTSEAHPGQILFEMTKGLTDKPWSCTFTTFTMDDPIQFIASRDEDSLSGMSEVHIEDFLHIRDGLIDHLDYT